MDKTIKANQVWKYNDSKWIIFINREKSGTVYAINSSNRNKCDTIKYSDLLKYGELLADNADDYFISERLDNRGKVINYDGVEYVIIKNATSKDNKVVLLTLPMYEINGTDSNSRYKVNMKTLADNSFVVSDIPKCDKDRLEKHKKWFIKDNVDTEVEITGIKKNIILVKSQFANGVENIIDFNDMFAPVDMIDDESNDKKKHSHYYKDIRHLDYIDIYRFCDLFIENDPSGALHHAIKKLAACGRRGAGKDELKDLQEAVDTINRKIEMIKEDKLKN